GQPSVPELVVGERLEEPLDAHREGLAAVRLVLAAALLSHQPQAADPLVTDGDRLRPPAEAGLLEDPGRDLLVLHGVGAYAVERPYPLPPVAACLGRYRLVADARQLEVVRRDWRGSGVLVDGHAVLLRAAPNIMPPAAVLGDPRARSRA